MRGTASNKPLTTAVSIIDTLFQVFRQMIKKQPPIEKIYEAWTAIADKRVTISPDSTTDSGNATVSSSDGKKAYKISWRDGGQTFTSTDNASFWQGYPGYPVIAVMITLGRLPYADEVARQFSGINWTELNAAHKRDYAAALLHIERERDIDPEAAAAAASIAYTALLESDITIRRK